MRLSLSTALVVLATNAVALAIELLATRLLFPDYGNTIFTWSSVISIIIAGFFAGYLAGGTLSERADDRVRLVFWELIVAGLLVMAIPFLKMWLLTPAGGQSHAPPLLGCFLVFGLPAAALATIPPAAVAILCSRGLSPSMASGTVSALSAAGSIAGTLATAFVLVPGYGVRGLFTAFGLALGALAVFFLWAGGGGLRSGKTVLGIGAYGLAVLFSGGLAAARAAPAGTRLLWSRDSPYQLVRVLEQGPAEDLSRILMLDSTWEGAMKVSTGETVFEYTRAYRLFLNALSPGSSARILFIGGGAYTMPILTASALPRAVVEVAEIDPAVVEAARAYFGLVPSRRLRTLALDGRQALRARQGDYDGLFIDAYQGVMAIPFHLTTREFFAEAARSLKPEGFLALNVIGNVLEREGFFCSLTKTLTAVYPWVRAHPVSGLTRGAQNIILIASKNPLGIPNAERALAGTGFEAGLDPQNLACIGAEALTDDHAPVEWLVSGYLKN